MNRHGRAPTVSADRLQPQSQGVPLLKSQGSHLCSRVRKPAGCGLKSKGSSNPENAEFGSAPGSLGL
jgi:hypothetical protein